MSGGGVTGDQLAGWWVLKTSLDTSQSMYQTFLQYYNNAAPDGPPATYTSAAAFNGKMKSQHCYWPTELRSGAPSPRSATAVVVQECWQLHKLLQDYLQT